MYDIPFDNIFNARKANSKNSFLGMVKTRNVSGTDLLLKLYIQGVLRETYGFERTILIRYFLT